MNVQQTYKHKCFINISNRRINFEWIDSLPKIHDIIENVIKNFINKHEIVLYQKYYPNALFNGCILWKYEEDKYYLLVLN